MALIDDLNDVANSGDKVSHLWVNAVASKFTEVFNYIQDLLIRVSALEAKLTEISLTQGAGRIVNYSGGKILMPDGFDYTIAPGTVTVPDNATSLIGVALTYPPTIVAGTDRVPVIYKLGEAIAASNAITNLSLVPRQRFVSEPQTWLRATKSGTLTLTANGVSGGVAGWTEQIDFAAAFNNSSGVFTVPFTDYYEIKAKSVIISDTASSMKAKMWLAVGSTEIAILGEVSVVVPNNAFRVEFNGWFEGSLTAGQNLTLQVQVDAGTNARILGDANTQIIVRRGTPR